MTAAVDTAAPRRVLQRFDAVVVGHELIAADVALVRVRSADAGRPLPDWEPGDHADLELEPGLVRQYSFCGTPQERGIWTFAVLLRADGAGGSRHVHQKLTVGDRIRVAGPKAMFALEEAGHHVFLAGGIGITPVLTMAESLAAAGRPFTLVYLGRSRDRMPFLDRVAALGSAALIVDRSRSRDLTLSQVLAKTPATALVYACGPARMMDEASRLVEPGRLRSESFAAAVPELGAAGPATSAPATSAPATSALATAGPATSALAAAVSVAPEQTPDPGTHGAGGLRPAPSVADGDGADPDQDAAFEVRFGVGGPLREVPAGTSLLDVLLDAGADIMWSCREGTCASCETVLLEGEADHRDHILTDAERAAQNCVFPCVSRARRGPLVLDLPAPG